MTDRAGVSRRVAGETGREYLTALGVSTTSTCLVLALVGEVFSAPSWASLLVSWVVLYAAFYVFRVPAGLRDGPAKPATRVVVMTGALSVAAYMIAALTVGDNLLSVFAASAAMLCVWTLSAWLAG